jgi:hypothetical protein
MQASKSVGGLSEFSERRAELADRNAALFVQFRSAFFVDSQTRCRSLGHCWERLLRLACQTNAVASVFEKRFRAFGTGGAGRTTTGTMTSTSWPMENPAND